MEVLSPEEINKELQEDILREAVASGEPQQAIFFERFAGLAAEAGDCRDLEYTPARHEGTRPWQIDGFAVDDEKGELFLALSDLRVSEDVESLGQAQIDSSFRRLERFLESAQQPNFVTSLEETSPAFQAAFRIHECIPGIRRVRLYLFTNARLVARKKSIDSREVDGRTLTYNLLDLTRYTDIQTSRTGTEDFDIDVLEMNAGHPISCLAAGRTGEDANSYLLVLPGDLLARFYGAYGARLLEQNVRTFLQAKTKVNRGIIDTIKDSPEMFFAYNNGLTMTAAGVELNSDGSAITLLRSPQIVNGGQTTASILYAKDRNRADLSRVFVQAKLTVVNRDAIEKVVPKISRFANTQNKVSEADLFSTHPFHVWMEGVSRRMSAPPRAGQLTSSKWFYERARGQFLNAQAYMTKPQRGKFLAEFPKEQLVDKPTLAKATLSLEGDPVSVSKGAQYAFMQFAERIVQQWDRDKDQFHDDYYRSAMAKVICFRATDRIVSRSDWYQTDRGHKANIVTYTLAWIANYVRENLKGELDFQKIWLAQEVMESLEAALIRCAPAVARVIKDPPATVKNVSEYAKRTACWDRVRALKIDLPVELRSSIVGREEIALRSREAKSVKAIDNGIELESKLLGLSQNANAVNQLVELAGNQRLLSPALESGRKKLFRGKHNLSFAERNAWRELLEVAGREGVDLDQ
jgi:hypothetical protein